MRLQNSKPCSFGISSPLCGGGGGGGGVSGRRGRAPAGEGDVPGDLNPARRPGPRLSRVSSGAAPPAPPAGPPLRTGPGPLLPRSRAAAASALVTESPAVRRAPLETETTRKSHLGAAVVPERRARAATGRSQAAAAARAPREAHLRGQARGGVLGAARGAPGSRRAAATGPQPSPGLRAGAAGRCLRQGGPGGPRCSRKCALGKPSPAEERSARGEGRIGVGGQRPEVGSARRESGPSTWSRILRPLLPPSPHQLLRPGPASSLRAPKSSGPPALLSGPFPGP